LAEEMQCQVFHCSVTFYYVKDCKTHCWINLLSCCDILCSTIYLRNHSL
jgi:hypothetical protein